MITLSGKMASGKDRAFKCLIHLGYKPVITYTTRPPRFGEVDGEDYHFLSEQDFLDKIEQGFFAETATYNTVNGLWYYGSAKEDYYNSDNSIIILNPLGLKQIKENGVPFISFYLDVDSNTRLQGVTKRGDNIDEVNRRIKADELDFLLLEQDVDCVINNDGYKHTPEKIATFIDDFVRGYNKA